MGIAPPLSVAYTRTVLKISAALSLMFCLTLARSAQAEEPNAAPAKLAARPAVTLDTSQLVDVPAWGANAAKLVEDWYGRIAEALGDPPPAAAPEIRLTLKEGKGVAETSGNAITVMAGWVRQHPEDIGLVVHELVHVVQAYPSPEPGWVTEGLADYVRWWRYEKSPQTWIDKAKATYHDSYRTTGAFFAWVEKQHPGTLRRVHQAMRQSAFRVEIFREATGRSVDELWSAFLAQWTNP